MNKELVSIVIPVYNAEKYVEETIESVVTQSYSYLEIILINDGSTDNSLDILEKYAKRDSRIRVIDKPNEGLSASREIGVQQARGIYFVTIDADDILDHDYVSGMYNVITEKSADIALCARKTFDAKGNEEVLLLNDVKSFLVVEREVLDNRYSYIAGEYQMSDSWNKMYRKSFVVSSDVHFNMPREYNGTDLLFNYRLLLHKPKIVTVNIPLYYYRLTENSRVRRKNKHLELGFRYILDELLNESRKCNGSVKLENQIYAAYFSMIKYATQDLTTEIQKMSNKEKIKGYEGIINTIPVITRSRKKGILKATRPELIPFVILLLRRSARGIFFYYQLRSYWRK